MILYLLLSVLFTSYLVIAFKVFHRFRVNTFHAIVVNYVVCVITGSAFKGGVPDYAGYVQSEWVWYAVLLGCSFVTLFNIMGYVTQRDGITVVSVATKLSMVIPICASFYLYGESATWVKIVGIALSFAAVYLTSQRDENHGVAKSASLLLPMVLFLGSGMNDTLVKHAQHLYLDNETFGDFLIMCFSMAAAAGLVALAYDVIWMKRTFGARALVAGVVLGVPNYFSIYFLLKALEHGDASFIYPVNNIGIVGFSAVVAWLFFKEHLSVKNWLGLGLAVAAIVLMSAG
ncbi:MAG TPA: SMR family transporter [Chitinophagales bacterium]|nr:SMR family transporter [Chitinophagales bacterium]